jgi:muramoyltetrapeptide carboxypeptidase
MKKKTSGKKKTSNRPLLSRGDGVGVTATGFAARPDRLRAGLKRLGRMGYRVRTGDHLGEVEGYLAGSDAQRGADLARMLLDDDLRAIWFARGGYGTARLLDSLPWRRIDPAAKLLVGYSDLTALFCAVLRRAETVCLYGPVVTELADAKAYDSRSLHACLRGEEIVLRFRKRQVVAPGIAAGRLLGGNLSVLAHLAGTRHLPSFRGAVLVLEDVGEEVYRLDRLLTHLGMAGIFRELSAVCLGSFDPPEAQRRFPPDRPLDDLVAEIFRPLGVPVVAGLPFGHGAGKRTLPLGGEAVLDTSAGTLRLAARPFPGR